MVTVENPILRGFNPDPSIVRVGHDYYIATSTFEYHPAVRLHHSQDLVHWRVVGHALHELDLRGIPDSGGVWAPSLTYAEGMFWLAYSVVRTMDGDDKDIDNYLVTAEGIEGPWSPPIHLGSRGIDFSFFHDPDGTHWIVGVQWDHRPEHSSFSGLVLEQYFPDEERTAGEATLLHREAGLVEGPNLYHVGQWYYLLIAAGGTGWNHGITLARSRNLLGPYERDQQPAVLTSRDAPGLPLQKAGHGELVQTQAGEWVLAHLASRPTLHMGDRHCTLGRETCLQRVVFDEEGWLRLAAGGHHAFVDVTITGESADDVDAAGPQWDDVESFDRPLDSRRWSTLRCAPDPETFDLDSRPGWLRLRGGHTGASVFEQSMLLQRVEEHAMSASVIVDAEPRTFREAAGLLLWYDRSGWIWLQITHDEDNGRHARVVRRDGTVTQSGEPVPLSAGPVTLSAALDGPMVRFAVGTADEAVQELPGSWDAWRLSDDAGPRLRFTGMFVGVRAEDLDGRGWSADFDDLTVSFKST